MADAQKVSDGEPEYDAIYAVWRRNKHPASMPKPGQPPLTKNDRAGRNRFPAEPGVIDGTTGYWADQLTDLYREHRQDTFSFWPNGDIVQQTEIFAKVVVPAVKERLGVGIA